MNLTYRFDPKPAFPVPVDPVTPVEYPTPTGDYRPENDDRAFHPGRRSDTLSGKAVFGAESHFRILIASPMA